MPSGELRFDGSDDLVQRWEVAVMQTESACELPDPFDGIQIRAVGRQVVQGELGLLPRPPRGVQRGVMIFGIVDDHHHAPPRPPTALPQLGQEAPGRHRVKAAGLAAEKKFAISQPDGSKVTDALARRRMEQDRIVHLGWDPHPAAGAVLLKMNFVHSPKINGGIEGQGQKFFYARLAFSDRPEPPQGGACGSENPTGERDAGIAAL